eukprot:SAG11_NODE_21856_length_417_cov_0.801887_1_plen_29_part_10
MSLLLSLYVKTLNSMSLPLAKQKANITVQ